VLIHISKCIPNLVCLWSLHGPFTGFSSEKRFRREFWQQYWGYELMEWVYRYKGTIILLCIIKYHLYTRIKVDLKRTLVFWIYMYFIILIMIFTMTYHYFFFSNQSQYVFHFLKPTQKIISDGRRWYQDTYIISFRF
jgi:hypothetical protein